MLLVLAIGINNRIPIQELIIFLPSSGKRSEIPPSSRNIRGMKDALVPLH